MTLQIFLIACLENSSSVVSKRNSNYKKRESVNRFANSGLSIYYIFKRRKKLRSEKLLHGDIMPFPA